MCNMLLWSIRENTSSYRQYVQKNDNFSEIKFNILIYNIIKNCTEKNPYSYNNQSFSIASTAFSNQSPSKSSIVPLSQSFARSVHTGSLASTGIPYFSATSST